MRVRLLAFVLVVLFAGTGAARLPRPHVLLAVFAHADDETFVGPVLARYAREGAKVYVAIATKGEKGATPHSGIPAGDALAEARRAEAVCACRELGIQPPVFFELNDGELGAITSPPGDNVKVLADRIRELIAKLNPQVVVTWGPEGGYGHPDHRVVSSAVTQVVQSEKMGLMLYYVGMTAEQARGLSSFLPPTMRWYGVDASYLTVTVPFTSKDQGAYHRAFDCYKSQFTADESARLREVLDRGWSGQVLFRPWSGVRNTRDLFENRR